MTTWVAAIVQPAPSRSHLPTVALPNVPTAGSAVHSRGNAFAIGIPRRGSELDNRAPGTVWSAVWMLTVGPLGTVIVTLSLAVSSSLSVTVKVKVTTWFAAVVPGAVQVVSSSAGSLNVPTAGRRSTRTYRHPSDHGLEASIEAPPRTVWSAVSMLTVGSVPRTVIVTLSLTSLSVASPSDAVRVRVTTWFAAVAAGAVQVGSSTAALGENIPPTSGAVTVAAAHARVKPLPEFSDVA